MLRAVLVGVLLFSGGASQAQFFMHDEGQLFVDSEIKKSTLGIEIEFAGISDETIVRLLKEHLEARVIQLPNLDPLEVAYQTKLGIVRLKVEGQAWRFENKDDEKFKAQLLIDAKKAPRELVFPR